MESHEKTEESEIVAVAIAQPSARKSTLGLIKAAQLLFI